MTYVPPAARYADGDPRKRAPGGARDARWERDHGTPLTPDQARARADARRPASSTSADYWDAYAGEAESWEADR